MFRTMLLAILGLALTAASAYILFSRSSVTAENYQMEIPVRATIVKKVIANGSIVPRQEVKIKPQISGVIEHIVVKRGDSVKKHDLLATIEPYPNPMDISIAETQLRDARVRFNHATSQFLRYKELYQKETITRNDYDQVQLDYRLAKQNLSAAERNVEIVKTGASRELGRSASEVRATIGGVVLERPIEIGTFVIESNTFNEGTTIVTLADMTDLIFMGQVDEPDAGKLTMNMPVDITVGADPDTQMKGHIEFIAPKAVTSKEGRITFEIRAGLQLDPNFFVRAGYSATAEIVIKRLEDVLALPERYLTFEDDKPTVFVETSPQVFESRSLQLGISDGLMVEIKDGLNENDHIRVQAITSPES